MILRLAWRSLWRNKRRTFITVVSIGMGLSFSIFFIALGDGVYYQLIEDSVRMQAGHVTVENEKYRGAPSVDLYVAQAEGLRQRLAGLDHVISTKLLVQGQGVARSGQGAVGVVIMGVEPAVEAVSSPIAKQITKGRYLEEGDGPLVVIGAQLADRLHLEIGRKLVITTNDVHGALTEELARVAGIFESGVDEIDGYVVQAPIGFMRKLYDMPAGAATQVGLLLDKPGAMERTIRQARPFLAQGLEVYPWPDIIPEVAAYIKLDGGSNKVFQAILLFLILFTIFNTILMSVLERGREFAVLLALGTRPWLMRLQLMCEAALIGLLGCVFGALVGGSLSYLLQVKGFDIRHLYSGEVAISGFAINPVIHSRLTPQLVITLSLIVIGATLVLSLIPMRRATNIDIADTLR